MTQVGEMAKRREATPAPHRERLCTLAVAAGTAGAGQALEDGARRRMESAFGHDFGRVRVHTDAAAAESARLLGAKAYTVADDIVFGPGRYAPRSPAGDRLLAHELTHTIQQEANPTVAAPGMPRWALGDPAGPAEIAAQQVADSVALRTNPPTSAPSMAALAPAPPVTIQREEDGESPWKSFWDNPIVDNPIWNTVTNNAVTGVTGFVERAAGGVGSGLPTLTSGLQKALGWGKGLDLGLDVEGALAAPGTAFPKALGQGAGGMSVANAVLGPLGVVSNIIGVHDALTREDNMAGAGLEATGDTIASLAGLISSGISTVGGAGAALSSLGATGAGGFLSGAASSATPVGAVLGAGAGGYALGELIGEYAIDPYLNRAHTEDIPVDEFGREKSSEELERERQDSWAYKISHWLEEE